MEFTRFKVNACCGKTSIILKTEVSLTTEHMKAFVNLGFIESPNFTKAGIMYLSNQDLIITGPLGADRLQIKCKNSNCEQNIADFEALLQKI